MHNKETNDYVIIGSGGGGTGAQKSTAWVLQQSLKVQCGSNQLTVSLPRAVADLHGVSGLFLSDRACSASRNATHWSLKKPLTSCGSTSRIDGKLTAYSNNVREKLCVPRSGNNKPYLLLQNRSSCN